MDNLNHLVMKRILVPTDFSENARNALYYALALYGNDPHQFILLNTFYIPYAEIDVILTMEEVTSENSRKQFKDLLNQIKADFPRHSFNIETEFTIGDLPLAAARISKRQNIDIIVMGTQGASGFPDVLLGSRTSAVIKHVECPVIAVPENSRYRELKKIVLAINHDENERINEVVLAPLLSIARKFNSELLLLHIADQEGNTDKMNTEHLSPMFRGLKHAFYTIHDKDVAHSIEDFVSYQEAQMLAMVTYRMGLFERIFHKSITRKMSLHTEIPLLVIHA